MDWRIMGSVIGPLVAFVGAIIASEISRRVQDAKQKGVADTEVALLSRDFREFKKDMKEDLLRIFEKIDKVMTEGAYPCRQVGIISSVQTQINNDAARLDRIQQDQSRMQQAIHDIESSLSKIRFSSDEG